MSAAAGFKAAAAATSLSMADGCLTSFPAHFTAKSCHLFLSLPARPIRVLHLACSSPSPAYLSCSSPSPAYLSHGNRAPLAPHVAQTSDWARQEENQADEAGDGENAEVLADEREEAGLFEWQVEGGALEDREAVGAVMEEVTGELVTGEGAAGDVVAEETYPEPPEEAKLFVGNLPYDMDSEKLAHLFEEAGIVEVAEVIYNRATGQSRGFGFVNMSTVDEAEKAVEKFHRYDLEGRLLTVNKAAPRGSRPERTRESESTFRVYVGNLPWGVDDARLEQAFSEYGKVVDSRVVYDRQTGRSRGFGFVTMSTKQEMDDAIAGLDGNSFDGRTVRVNVAEEKPAGGSF